MAVKPAECFCLKSAHILLVSHLYSLHTFVIPLFLTKTCFLGAMLLAPFFGPSTVCRLPDDFAVAVVSFFDLIVPCAISLLSIFFSSIWIVEVAEDLWFFCVDGGGEVQFGGKISPEIVAGGR
jgi:hypothetical protein